MHRRLLVLCVVAICAVAPLSASQFIRLPFDQLAREANMVVRGTLGPVHSAWDDSREVIYSYSVMSVSRHLAGFGPRTIVVREVGGVVDGYTQEAIGFPVLREGEEVVFFLSKWDDGSTDWRIHAYTQGKMLVRNVRGVDMVVQDPVTQGDRPTAGEGGRTKIQGDEAADGLTMAEFQTMVRAARAAAPTGTRNRE